MNIVRNYNFMALMIEFSQIERQLTSFDQTVYLNNELNQYTEMN